MVGRPPLIAVKDGSNRELRRETIADLLSRDRAFNEPRPLRPELVESGYESLVHSH